MYLFSQLRQIDFFLGLRNYHLKTKQFTSIYILYMFVHCHSTWLWDKSSISPAAMWTWILEILVICIMYNAIIYDYLLPSNATQNACEFTWFFKSTPLSLKLKKNTLMTTCQVPLDLSPCFVRVQVLIVVPRWCFWKWMCLGVWVLEMHVCGETLSIFDWLITRFGHVIPADTCCVPFVSTILKSAHLW